MTESQLLALVTATLLSRHRPAMNTVLADPDSEASTGAIDEMVAIAQKILERTQPE